jgi:UV DNA damage endonuclease
MVLDIHHHAVNNGGEDLGGLWPRILGTWRGTIPKIHVSSPKSAKSPRSHADYVDREQFMDFVRRIKDMDITPRLDVMIEAKMKDGALFRLMEELADVPGVTALDQASVEIEH